MKASHAELSRARGMAFAAAMRAYDQYYRATDLWGVLHPVTTRYYLLWQARADIWRGCVERVVKGERSGHQRQARISLRGVITDS